MLYAGERIWSSERDRREPYESVRAMALARGNRRWEEGKKNGFCNERWGLWREMFAREADMEDVWAETRELAGFAAGKMGEIEGNDGSAQDG